MAQLLILHSDIQSLQLRKPTDKPIIISVPDQDLLQAVYITKPLAESCICFSLSIVIHT